ncbi:MAG TPA: PLDc N-terminal domain-containing protein [Ktedonobacteraceae bacterium]|nr:PLDc N-terminal domain-containing protein [Ktedonobacteraceae bacterium]
MPMLFSLMFFVVIFVIAVSLLGTAFWLWMVVDCIMNKTLSDMQKALWATLIFFTHFIGALIYFFVARQSQPKQPTYQYYEQTRTSYHSDPPQPNRPYEQGYQAPPAAPRQYNNVPPPIYPEQAQRSPVDYEQPQAMYPHEQRED